MLAKLWHAAVPHITVRRRLDGCDVYFDLKDNIDDLTRRDFAERELFVPWLCQRIEGLFWDVGCNIGQFAITASRLNHAVVAFDISPRACGLLALTAARNKLPVTVVNRALAVASFAYSPPATARPNESLSSQGAAESRVWSLTVEEALVTYGKPALIKMDIEGAEAEFLKSASWRQWMANHDCYWLLEFHRGVVADDLLWRDLPHVELDRDHYLFHANGEKVRELALAWRPTR